MCTDTIQKPTFFHHHISHYVIFTLPRMSYVAFGRLQALLFVMAILKGKFCTPFYSLQTSESYFGPRVYTCLNQGQSTLAFSAPRLLLPNYFLPPCGCTMKWIDPAKTEPFPFTTRAFIKTGENEWAEKGPHLLADQRLCHMKTAA